MKLDTVLSIVRMMAPHGLIRTLDWANRFRRINAPSKLALSSNMRQAMLTSRVELLPFNFGDPLQLVVDIGANQGNWTKSIRTFYKVSKSVLVEPNPRLVEEYLSPLQLIEQGLTVHQCALGRQPGHAKLNITQGSALSSLLPVHDVQRVWHGDAAAVVGEVVVPVTTLDILFADDHACDLLKVDVQGLEKEVLEGGRNLLARTRCLLLEMDFERHYAGDTSWYDLARYLIDDLGFKFWDISQPERRIDGRALWADVCFVHGP